jgi:hypothetical protein
MSRCLLCAVAALGVAWGTRGIAGGRNVSAGRSVGPSGATRRQPVSASRFDIRLDAGSGTRGRVTYAIRQEEESDGHSRDMRGH